MAVVRLRTRRDAGEQAALEAILRMLQGAAGAAASPVLERIAALAGRELAATRGWSFVMVEPRLYAQVVTHLAEHSRRKVTALKLWARLFELLPPDSNEVMADR